MSLRADTVSGVDPFATELRVLHVLQPTEAGVWRYATEMASWQADRGWDVHIASPVDPAGLAQWHEWRAVRSPARGLRSESARLRQVISDVRPQVIVAHSSKAGLITRVTVRGRTPTVFIPHAWSFRALTQPVATAALAWERWAARWTNAIVAVGAGEATTGVRRGVRAPVFLVPNPVPRRWCEGERRSREELDLPAGPLVVCVGRLARQKGIDVLLRAWPEVVRGVPAASLVVVGDGPDREELQASATKGVVFVGAQEDPWSFVEAASVVAVPSRWEGLSLSMLEAMWSGSSMVVTDVDGSEVVRQAEAGRVVPIEDSHALAQALSVALADPARARANGVRGAAYVRANHNFEGAADRLAAVVSRAYAFGAPTGVQARRASGPAVQPGDHSIR